MLDKCLGLYFSRRCSMKCPYCSGSYNIKSKPSKNGIVEKLGKENYVEKIRFLIREPISILLGGPAEPTIHRAFDYIASEMAQDGHKIIILTNLSNFKSILRLIDAVDRDPKEWLSLGVSYHLGTMLDRNLNFARKKFVENMIAFGKFGCETKIITPLTPSVLRDENYVGEMLSMNSTNTTLLPIRLGGTYNEDPYPKSYTDEDVELYEKLFERLHIDYIDAKDESQLSVLNRPCVGPMMFTRIGYDGSIAHCWHTKEGIHGNLKNFEGDLFKSESVNCIFKRCYCRGVAYNCCINPPPNGSMLDIMYKEA